MDTIVGNFYLADNKLVESDKINSKFNASAYKLYEVIRVEQGTLLFLEDHLDRMQQGVKSIAGILLIDYQRVRADLFSLLKANNLHNGNIKLLCRNINEQLVFAAYFVPHKYPDKDMYTRGVKLATFTIERTNPGIKQVAVSERVRDSIEKIKLETSAYEILLIDKNGFITEGSKSNFFLVKGNSLYSAPEDKILAGITRKHIISLARSHGLKVFYNNICIGEIVNFDGSFICGTSPKILTVKCIDQITFKSKNSIITLLNNEYNSLVDSYIKNNKSIR
jgi:branched-chain amino acid aminotransferase